VKASSRALIWGPTPDERELPFPSDRYLADPDSVCWRAVDVEARPSVVFRWLCQVRVAPYSYDLLDNLGRRSPQTLTEGLDQLELGQRFMTMFELVEFEQDRHITLLTNRFQWCSGTWQSRTWSCPLKEAAAVCSSSFSAGTATAGSGVCCIGRCCGSISS
jgi:hypothetical protein